jgi:hypothetical protein
MDLDAALKLASGVSEDDGAVIGGQIASLKEAQAGAEGRNCTTCRDYYRPDSICMHGPPVPVVVGVHVVEGREVPTVESLYPVVTHKFMCGQWRPAQREPSVQDWKTANKALSGYTKVHSV